MLWVAVWTVLVLGTLGGAVWLGLRLWRSGKALLAQLKETTEVLERLQVRIDELEAAREPTEATPPALLATDDERERWRTVRAQNLDARAHRRQRRRARAHARWHDLLDPTTTTSQHSR